MFFSRACVGDQTYVLGLCIAYRPVGGRAVQSIVCLCIIVGCECTVQEDGCRTREAGHVCSGWGPYWGYRTPHLLDRHRGMSTVCLSTDFISRCRLLLIVCGFSSRTPILCKMLGITVWSSVKRYNVCTLKVDLHLGTFIIYTSVVLSG
jgi:hypothetical protein